MQVKSITRKNYMIPGEHTLTLPKRGLVLVTGGNGTGKSSWIDSVGSVWNLTLRDPKARKARGNLEGEQAFVSLATHNGDKIDRVWSKKGKCALEWEHGGIVDTGTTRSKSQKALIATIGDFQGWRWANVITSDSADSFTTATPATRRKILEDVLDLHLLAAAYSVAHEDTKTYTRDLKELERAVIAAESSHALIEQAAQSAQQALDRLVMPTLPSEPKPLEPPRKPQEPSLPELMLPEPPEATRLPEKPTGAPEDKQEELRAKVQEYRDLEQKTARDLEQLQKAKKDIEIRLGKARNDVKQAEEAKARIAHDQCPTCTQEVSREVALSFEEGVHQARKDFDALRSACEEEEQDILAAIARAEELNEQSTDRMWAYLGEMRDNDAELTKYRQKLESWEREVDQVLESSEAARVRHERMVEQMTKDHEARVAQLQACYQAELAQYEQDVATLKERSQEQHKEWENVCRVLRDQHEATRQAMLTANVEAQERLRVACDTLTDTRAEKEETERKLRLSLNAERVLGPSGPRSTLLNDAMKSIEAHANDVLMKVGSHIRVQLYAEDKDVGLRVTGECATEYVDLSNGERRRVDLAVLLALGEVASSTRGQNEAGTLFLDEFLDAVDHEGLQEVCDYVMWLSTKRCVVVVTHREEVASRLRPTKSVVMKR